METTLAPKISQTTSTMRAPHFLELFLDADFWGLLCHQTNLRAEQVKQFKPASYYAKNFKPVTVHELKAFLGLRLQMEKCVIKPRYETYWQGAGHNFIAHTPGFREVMERDCFIALWGFLHLVDRTRPWTSPTRFTKSGPCSTECSLSFAEDGLHSRHRNLHRQVQGPPLAPPRISRQCCPSSCGKFAGHQQEPHAVHGPLLQLCCALTPAEERAGSPGHRHRHAKPTALPQVTRQEADRTWPLQIPVPRSSVCQRLEGL